MSTFEKCGKEVRDIADELLAEFATHKPIKDRGVKIDFVFAFADLDENGEPSGPALVHHGYPAHAMVRKLPLKDRVLGRGDAEITIDGDWWNNTASDGNKRSVIDHELHHLAVNVKTPSDAIGRPNLKLRKHDVQVGWFKIIAERHGDNSIECQQAKTIMGMDGQYFWPDLFKAIPVESRKQLRQREPQEAKV